jgi:hypothetical protein
MLSLAPCLYQGNGVYGLEATVATVAYLLNIAISPQKATTRKIRAVAFFCNPPLIEQFPTPKPFSLSSDQYRMKPKRELYLL